MKTILIKLRNKQHLTVDEMIRLMDHIFNHATEAETTEFLTLLSIKGEVADEIYGVVKYMQASMQPIDTNYRTLDIVGTGGDGFNTMNISTASALIAAAGGVKILKHGNQSVSSRSGSADFLDAMGYNIFISKEKLLKDLEVANFGFLFAPQYHPLLKKMKRIRKKIGKPTIFNLVGPLLNPARPSVLMIGVCSASLLTVFAEVLLKMKVKRAIVYCCRGIDEICTVAPIDMVEVRDGSIAHFQLNPKHYGFKCCDVDALKGGDASDNKIIFDRVLRGESNAITDSIILNVAIAYYLYGLSEHIESGIVLARSTILNGLYKSKVNQIIKLNKQTLCQEVSYA